MPGMMDTSQPRPQRCDGARALEQSAATSASPGTAIAASCQMYGDVVLGLEAEDKNDADPFEQSSSARRARGVQAATPISTSRTCKELVSEFKKADRRSDRQATSRRIRASSCGGRSARCSVRGTTSGRSLSPQYEHIPDEWGTAVNVQSMVFGNMGDDCATGVAFTRDPATGENVFYGEYLINAQGEDVVAGIRTPQASSRDARTSEHAARRYEELGVKVAQEARESITATCRTSSSRSRRQALHAADAQRQAHRLSRRCASPSTWSKEKLIDEKTALKRVDPDRLDQLLQPRLRSEDGKKAGCDRLRGLPPAPARRRARSCSPPTKPRQQPSAGERK